MAEKKNIRDIYTPSDEHKERIRHVYDRKRAMEEGSDRSEAAKNWDRWEKQYESIREQFVKPDGEWNSNHVAPLTFSAIETALSEVTEQQVRPMVLPRGSEDESKARVMQRIFDYTCEISNYDMLTYDALKDAFTYGTAITQEYFLKDMRKIRELNLENGESKITEKEVAEYEDVMGEIVKLQDFFVDENARGFSGPFAARDCIRRYITTLDNAKQFFKGPIWDQFDAMKYVVAGGDTNYYEFYKPPSSISDDKKVEILWYWSRYPHDALTIVINDVLVKDGPNPYKHKQLPFVRWLDVKRPHRFYGKGECEILESTQDETNILRRMTIDRNHLDIDKMFLVSNRLGLTDEDVQARPHGMIPVDDVNAAKPVDYNDVPRSVEISLKHLEDDATISTGINPRAQAMPTAGTATEAAILKESTLKRLRLKVWLMKKESLSRLAQLRVSNIIQFYSQPKMTKIVGEAGAEQYEAELTRLKAQGLLVSDGKDNYAAEYRMIPLEDEELDIDEKGMAGIKDSQGVHFFPAKPDYFMPMARGGFNIKFDAGSTLQISKALQQSKDLELFDRVFQIAQAYPNTYDPTKLGDMILKSYEKDPNSLKPDQAVQNSQDKQLEMVIALAGLENKQMIKGVMVPPTAYASPVHTRVHLEFMNSEEFQKTQDPNVDKAFTEHVTGEIMAQTGRAEGAGITPPDGTVPEGDPGTNPTSSAQGITNRPGGVAQPQNRMSDIMPARNTGRAAV